MQKIRELKTSQKVLLVLTVGVLLAAAVFFSIRPGGGEDTLNTAVTAGELALSSIGRNYESLTQFTGNNETQARQLLQAAEVALENAKARLNSVKRTNDDYILGMLDNYQRVVNASEVMSKGVDNLLTVSGNMTAALDYYFSGDYEKAAEKASYCLDVLTPLQGEFDNTRNGLTGINDVFVPSGQRDRLTLRVNQYSNETDVYNQYVLLLRSLLAGKDYLQTNSHLEDLMKQLQNAIANQEYDKADQLRQDISKLLESMRDPNYQNAADLASQLNPDQLGGSASSAAQQLRDRLRNLEGLDGFQSYLNALEQYLQASRLQSSDPSGAEQAINQGRGILGQGQPGDPELRGMYQGLLDAFNTLEMQIKGQSPLG